MIKSTPGQKSARFCRMLNSSYRGGAGVLHDETLVDRADFPESQSIEEFARSEKFKKKYLPHIYVNE